MPNLKALRRGDPSGKCPLDKPKNWLEVELISEATSLPVAFERYSIILPDRLEAAEGTLNQSGWVRIEGIAADGDCKITFPELDYSIGRHTNTDAARQTAGPKGEVRFLVAPILDEHVRSIGKGDCCSSLEYREGLSWQKIFQASNNSRLREVDRNDPNCLHAGEQVTIPGIQPVMYTGALNQRHIFRMGGVVHLVVCIAYSDGAPRGNTWCTLLPKGKAKQFEKTGADGKVTFTVHPLSTEFSLEVAADTVIGMPKQIFQLECGSLEPHATLTGVQQRLRNLGSWDLQGDGIDGAGTKAAVSLFRRSQGLADGDAVDASVWNSLRTAHGA